MVALFAAANLAPILPKDLIKTLLIEDLVLSLVDDPTANVKLNVGISLDAILPLLTDETEFISTKVEPALKKLLEDKDIDVKFYASLPSKSTA